MALTAIFAIGHNSSSAYWSCPASFDHRLDNFIRHDALSASFWATIANSILPDKPEEVGDVRYKSVGERNLAVRRPARVIRRVRARGTGVSEVEVLQYFLDDRHVFNEGHHSHFPFAVGAHRGSTS